MYISISNAVISVLSKLVTLEVLQPTPLKRISSRDSKQEPKEGKRDYITYIRDHMKDYTTSNAKPHRDLEIHG